MLRIVVDFCAFYLFGAITGAGIYRFMIPANLRGRALALLLLPAIGLLQVAIVGTYFIYASLPLGFAPAVSIVLGVLELAASLRFVGPLATTTAYFDAVRAQLTWQRAVVFGANMLLVASPLLAAGMPTTTYRIGIDEVGYAESSQFLHDGGTIRQLRNTLFSELQTNDEKKAYAQNIKDLHFETYVDSEFLLKAFRLGFPSLIATLALVAGEKHVYAVLLSSLLVNYGLFLALVFFAARRVLELSETAALSAMSAVAANSLLLNVYLEGQLAQVFVQPFFFASAFIVLSDLRRRGATFRSRWTDIEFRRSIFLSGVIFAGLFCTYNEVIVVYAAFFACVTVVDIFLQRSTSRNAIAACASAFAIGFIVAAPVAIHWVTYTFANLGGLSHAGFWQPHWASPAEIAGILNLYDTVGYSYVARTPVNIALNLVISLAIVYGWFVAAFNRKIDRSLWLVPIVLIVAAYVKMHYVDDILNYAYTKICTTFAAPATLAAFAGISAMRLPRCRIVPALLALAAFASGAYYTSSYVMGSKHVDAAMFELYSVPRRFSDSALVTPANNLDEFILTPLITMNWLNEQSQDDGQKVVAPYLARPLIALYYKRDIPCLDCFQKKYRRDKIFENADFLAIDTHKALKDVCVAAAPAYTIEKLGYDSLEREWPGLPVPECDYFYAKEIMAPK